MNTQMATVNNTTNLPGKSTEPDPNPNPNRNNANNLLSTIILLDTMFRLGAFTEKKKQNFCSSCTAHSCTEL